MDTIQLTDLHVHSTFSDGTLTPTQLIFLAKEKKLEALALTDHDTLDGLEEFQFAGNKYDIEPILGIEFATYLTEKIELHLIGLFIDPNKKGLQHCIKDIQEKREIRNLKMAEKLSSIGLALNYEEVQAEAGDKIVTRAHFAKLLEKKGYTKTKGEAFSKYISPGGPGYIPRPKFTPEECIQVIHEAGGTAVLAHPTLYGLNYLEIFNLSKRLKKEGLDGIEVYYSTYTKKQEEEIRKISESLHLKPSGGSDFHGANKPDIDLGIGRGNLKIPYSIMLDLKPNS